MNIEINEAKEAIKKSFDACRKKYGPENILGYSICSDDSAITISPRVATKEGLNKFLSSQESDFLFNPDEWDGEAEHQLIENLSNQIYDLYESSEDYENNPNWHEEHRSYVYNLMYEILLYLDCEDYFECEKDKTLITPWVCDSEVPRQRAEEWSETLNSRAIHLTFTSWLKTTNYWNA